MSENNKCYTLNHAVNQAKFMYKATGTDERRYAENDLFGFDNEIANDIWRIRIIKGNEIMLYDEMPNEELCKYWVEDLKKIGYDFDCYDIKQGTLMEGGGRWW